MCVCVCVCVPACLVTGESLSTDVGHHAGQGLRGTRPPVPQLAGSVARGAAELRRFVQDAEPPLGQKIQQGKTTTTTTTTAAVKREQ